MKISQEISSGKNNIFEMTPDHSLPSAQVQIYILVRLSNMVCLASGLQYFAMDDYGTKYDSGLSSQTQQGSLKIFKYKLKE